MTDFFAGAAPAGGDETRSSPLVRISIRGTGYSSIRCMGWIPYVYLRSVYRANCLPLAPLRALYSPSPTYGEAGETRATWVQYRHALVLFVGELSKEEAA